MKKKGKILAGFIFVLILCMGMGIQAEAAKKNGWVKEGAITCYYKNGVKQKGWLTVSGSKYYLKKTTGERVTGKVRIKKVWYYFGKQGKLLKTYKKAGWKKDSTGKWFSYGDGTYPKKCWMNFNGNRYRFDKRGYVVTGWSKIGGKWYYFSGGGIMQKSKWIKSKSGTDYYYLTSTGAMAVNAWVDSGKYYVDGDGKWIQDYVDQRRNNNKKTGWVGYGRTWRYYENNRMITGLKTITKTNKGQTNKQTYYFDSSGYMKTGFQTVKGRTYFLYTVTGNSQYPYGCSRTGRLKINGKLYFFYPKNATYALSSGNRLAVKKGEMAKNITLKIGNITYHFDSKGVGTTS